MEDEQARQREVEINKKAEEERKKKEAADKEALRIKQDWEQQQAKKAEEEKLKLA